MIAAIICVVCPIEARAGETAFEYTVVQGDTLYDIAIRFGTTTNALAASNGLNPNAILRPGQVLEIRTAGASFTEHRIASGDTLYDLALAYGTSVTAICRENGISQNTLLRVGQVLRIPSASAGTQTAANTDVEREGPIIHTVRSGETLSHLALKYSTTALEIAQQNGISVNSMLKIGQQLVIPEAYRVATAPSSDTPIVTPEAMTGILSVDADFAVHCVRPGDTLYDLAAHYGTTVAAIAVENGINANAFLRVDQNLIIPLSGVPGRRHDTLASRSGSVGAEAITWSVMNPLFPRGAVATITDVRTGESFQIKRLGGTLHADVEPLTRTDADTMKRIWGGWSWNRRSVVFEYEGLRVAASMNGMPHGGQSIGTNGISGHVCLHFLESKLHCSGRMDPDHQAAVRAAVGK